MALSAVSADSATVKTGGWGGGGVVTPSLPMVSVILLPALNGTETCHLWPGAHLAVAEVSALPSGSRATVTVTTSMSLLQHSW